MRKQKKYQGRPSRYLCVKCEKCGDVRGFFSREAIEYNRCKVCDRKTVLTDLTPAVLKCCYCDGRTVISTNMTEHVVTITCPFCRGPVDFELDSTGTTYRTMEESC
jgi:ribosomal protein S27E